MILPINKIVNPLQEHLVEQKVIRSHNIYIGYCLSFLIGVLVSYLILKSRISLGMMDEE